MDADISGVYDPLGDPITAKHCHCSQCQVLHGERQAVAS